MSLPSPLPYLAPSRRLPLAFWSDHIPSLSASSSSPPLSVSSIMFRMKSSCPSGLLFCFSSPHPPELCVWLCEYVICSCLLDFVNRVPFPRWPTLCGKFWFLFPAGECIASLTFTSKVNTCSLLPPPSLAQGSGRPERGWGSSPVSISHRKSKYPVLSISPVPGPGLHASPCRSTLCLKPASS